MQVLHRSGDGRGQDAAPETGAMVSAHDHDGLKSADTELEIRASQLTAVAVAAASVTSAVVTAESSFSSTSSSVVSPPAALAVRPVLLDDGHPVSAPPVQPQAESAPARVVAEPNHAPVQTPVASPRGALLVSMLTLGVIGLLLWWSTQSPWPERGLKPVVRAMSGWNQAAPAATAPAQAPDVAAPTSPSAQDIAQLQQEAAEKAHALAQKRAAAEARRQREDAAQALREQRRREAEAQLAEARARAERAQAAPNAAPLAVEAPAVPALADEVRQCQALTLLARDNCLRTLCNGKWGKQGCPANDTTYDGA